jgi:hypothetical protein
MIAPTYRRFFSACARLVFGQALGRPLAVVGRHQLFETGRTVGSMISKPDGITPAAAQACCASAGVAKHGHARKAEARDFRRRLHHARILASGSTTLPPYPSLCRSTIP